MKPKQNPACVRTGKIVPAAGMWILRCMREGCGFVERISLLEGVPAPPCRHCQNPAWCRFLHAPAPVRTSEPIPISGTWRSECAREGCNFIEDLVLAEDVPAPPCRHCCNRSQLTYRGPGLIVDETRIGTVKGPQLPPAFEENGVPTESVHSALGGAAAEASATIVEAPMQPFDSVISTPKEEKPAAEKAAADPIEKKKVEGPAIAEVEPSLFQRLNVSSGRRKPENASLARK